MKKILAFMMCIIMLALPGCKPGGESPKPPESKAEASEAAGQEPLRVFMDVEFGSSVFVSLRQLLDEYEEEVVAGGKTKFVSFEEVIASLGGPEDIELEIAPKHGQEREIRLTALRTEMMAGKGPDVFVTSSGCGWHPFEDSLEYCFEESMFKFPRQAMERNMFLPLDEYIENAQFMEWDKLTPVIMEAGKNEHGQLLLPMTYTMPLGIFYRKDFDFSLEGNAGLSWRDMVGGPKELQQTAAYILENLHSAALAPLADYENDKLALSEEELLQYVASRLETAQLFEGEERPRVGELYPGLMSGASGELSFVPTYSVSGGYSAIITSFAAINVNTKRPDDAFFVVDYIMGREAQQSKLYCHMTESGGVPTLEGLMSRQGYGVYSILEDTLITMPDCVYQEFEKIRDNASGADFYTVLDSELRGLFAEIYDNPDKPVEKLAHDCYMRMNMMLAES